MKTSKTTGKSRKISENDEPLKRNFVKISSSGPSEEEIRELAEVMYHQRIDRGEHGTAEKDWLEAEEFQHSFSREVLDTAQGAGLGISHNNKLMSFDLHDLHDCMTA